MTDMSNTIDFETDLSLYGYNPSPPKPYSTQNQMNSNISGNFDESATLKLNSNISDFNFSPNSSQSIVRNDSLSLSSPTADKSLSLSGIRDNSVSSIIGSTFGNTYETLTAPKPKRIIDSSELEGLFKDDSTRLSDSAVAPHFINSLFLDDDVVNTTRAEVSTNDHYSRPSSRLLDMLGSPGDGRSTLHSPSYQSTDQTSQIIYGFENHFNISGTESRNKFEDTLQSQPLPQDSFYNFDSPNIPRPASTPITSTSLYGSSLLFGSDGSNGGFLDNGFQQSMSLLEQPHLNHMPSKSITSLDALHQLDISNQPGLTYSNLQGSASEYNLSSMNRSFDLNDKFSQSGRGNPRGNPSQGYPQSGYRGPSHGQVHHPMFRSNVNIQTINSYRHSAAPVVKSHHGSHHYGSNPVASEQHDPVAVEALITNTCKNILKDASSRALKAVELANTLRARVGTDVLAFVRENWGGLLSLLEKHPKWFRVDRIPKNDMVTLCDENTVWSSEDVSDLSYNSSSGQQQEDGTFSMRSGYTNSTSTSASEHTEYQPSYGSDAGYVSKCLHVGNVPINLTEKDLIKEFDKYGSIESVKLINQRGRRFAFVCYKTMEMAANAKSILSRLHPWKSAISFAHRDFAGNALQVAHYSTTENISAQQYRTSSQPQQSHGLGGGVWNDPHAISAPSRVMSASPFHSGGSSIATSRTYTPPPSLQSGAAQPRQLSLPHESHSISDLASLGGVSAGTVPTSFRRSQSYAAGDVYNGYFPDQPPVSSDPSTWNYHDPYMAQPTLQHQQSASAFNQVILRRLCDDTYVPTQTWPLDVVNDSPFIEAIIAQLLQFGGSTSISKLRGFLRTRIIAQDNIKSVPLKALLAAYPQFFHVRNNQVTLLDLSKSSGSIYPLQHEQVYSDQSTTGMYGSGYPWEQQP